MLGVERNRLGELIARFLILALLEQVSATREARLGLHALADSLEEPRRRGQNDRRRRRRPSRAIRRLVGGFPRTFGRVARANRLAPDDVSGVWRRRVRGSGGRRSGLRRVARCFGRAAGGLSRRVGDGARNVQTPVLLRPALPRTGALLRRRRGERSAPRRFGGALGGYVSGLLGFRQVIHPLEFGGLSDAGTASGARGADSIGGRATAWPRRAHTGASGRVAAHPRTSIATDTRSCIATDSRPRITADTCP